MRRIGIALACVVGGALSGCGGSGGASTPAPLPTARLQITAAADDASRAPSGVVHAQRIEVRNTGDASARAVVVSVASPDAQVLQLPLGCESAGCAPRSDGGVDIAEIPAGASVVLRQPLRVKPGYRGAVRNDWQFSATGLSGVWRQDLTAYVADLAVTVGAPDEAFVHEVTLTNQGPDDAIDATWELLSASPQTLQLASCTATGGAVCPATLGETMKLPRVPAGGSLRLRVKADAADPRLRGVVARIAAAGDPDPGNDSARSGQASTEHLFMTDLEGRDYRLSIGSTAPLRVMAPGLDYRVEVSVDVTGQGVLGAPGSVTPAWGRGTISFWSPVMLLGLDIGGVRKPYLAPRQLVTQLQELDGFTFNVLGSRADATGRPTGAYVGSARFQAGVLQLCLPDAPLPFEQCPAARLSRFEAALVGSEVELVAKDKVMRLRAARTPDGPILISSTRNAATGASEFWIALPSGSGHPFRTFESLLHEATFESASGVSTPTLASIDTSSDVTRVSASLSPGLPNFVFLAANTGTLGVCGLTAQLNASTQPRLFQGVLQGDWLPGAYQDGQFVKERPCFSGAVHHAQTTHFGAFVGAGGGSLMGRWMFVGER